MAQKLDVRRFMFGDNDRVDRFCHMSGVFADLMVFQDSIFINELLTQIHGILCERGELSPYIIYDLSERASRERERWQRLLSYPGPDPATLQLLENHAEDWSQNPATFWNGQLPNDLSGLPPIAQIIGCFLQTESDNA